VYDRLLGSDRQWLCMVVYEVQIGSGCMCMGVYRVQIGSGCVWECIGFRLTVVVCGSV
jgi:hypothetical protein